MAKAKTRACLLAGSTGNERMFSGQFHGSIGRLSRTGGVRGADTRRQAVAALPELPFVENSQGLAEKLSRGCE